MHLMMYGDTNIGMVRKNNQDSIFFDSTMGLGVVADGIGGRRGGEVASSMVVNSIRNSFLKSDRIRHEETPSFITSSIDRANKEVFEKSLEDQDVSGMGTTVNCLLFNGKKVHIGHVGDSRTYLYDKGNLWQLTVDHSVHNFIKRGLINASAVLPGAKPDALTRAVGLLEEVEVELYEIELKPGQILLSCSDGLSGMVKSKRIAEIITDSLSRPEKMPSKLIKEANLNGGRDNITVLISHLKGER